jgi:hypothetical protein
MTSLIVYRGSASFEDFVQNNAVGDYETFFLGEEKSSISKQLNSLIRDGGEDFAVIAVSDLVLPDGWLDSVPDLAKKVRANWPSSVAITGAGLTLFEHGYATEKVLDYLVEVGYEGATNIEMPVVSSNPELIVIDLELLREFFPNGFMGFLDADFHLWFCLELAVKSLNVVASPLMSAFMPNGNRRKQLGAQPSSELLDYVAERANVKSFETFQGKYSIPFNPGFDLLSAPPSLETLFLGPTRSYNKPPSLTVITRTQFERVSELKRCLDSVMSFASHYGEHLVNRLLVSDSPYPQNFNLPQGFQFVQATVPQGKDSRFMLVGEAVSSVSSDYYMFVDDDDWMFPNNASALRQMLDICPRDSVVFADSRHYIEDRDREDSIFVGNKLTNGRHFPGNRFMGSLAGVNNNPFCSVIFPRKTFEDLDSKVYSSVEYAEDYFLILKTLYQESVPFVFDGQLVGISIRESGNTVTEFGHPKWLRAKANVAYSLANTPALSKGKFVHMRQSTMRSGSLLARIWRTLFDGRLWKLAFQYKILEKIISGQISPKYAVLKLVSLIRKGW